MPIFDLDWEYKILLIIVCWTIAQTASARLVQIIPDRFVSPQSDFFATHKWEDQGRIYNRLFKVKKWKHLLPDGGAKFRGGFSRRHVQATNTDALNEHLRWSTRGELAHWLNFLILPAFPLFLGPLGLTVMCLYACLSNIPCLISYRYNRPRIIALLAQHHNRK